MTLAPEIIERLNKPLDPDRVKHREGSGGRSLSYLEGHDIIRAANDVFGYGGWGYVVNDLTLLGEEPFERKDFKTGEVKKGIRVGYRALVVVNVGDVAFSDVGYGDAQEYNGSRITPHELASKEAVTDALKRALKNLGDQFGLCLYDKYAPEHSGAPRSGANQVSAPSSGPTADQSAGGGTVAGRGTAHVPPATASSGGFVWASGKHEGKTLADTPKSYLEWYSENGPKPDAKAACREFLNFEALAAVGAVEVDESDIDGDSIPF